MEYNPNPNVNKKAEQDAEKKFIRKMIIWGILAVVVLLLIIIAACCRTTVEPGHEKVFNAKPMFFKWAGGVRATPLKEGSAIIAPTTSEYDVNMLPQTFDEEFVDIMPKDNNPVDYHAAVRLRITDSVGIVKNFGGDWYKANIQRPFQTMNRQEFRQYSMPQLALQQEVVLAVEQSLKSQLLAYVKSIKRKDGLPGGLPVDVQDITLGRISPQKEITDSYNETGVQQQRAKTETKRAEAELTRKQAETNRALADKAYQDTMGLSASQYIQLMQIKMCADKASGCTVILNGSATPVIPVK